MKSYSEAAQVLGARRGRKLENNTYLERRSADSIAVRLHSTDVVTYYADGKVVLNSGGWRTVTTKDRLNKYAPVNVVQEKRVWYVVRDWKTRAREVFEDGYIFEPEAAKPFDEIGAIIAYECGELSDEKTVELFQHLTDNGHAWTLQGHYGRTATALIEAGHCRRK